MRTNIIGTYDAQKNLILVDKDNYISSIYHELFHMSSSTYKNGIIYSYNNGLAEGSVNKIKVIKRVMYGRNSFELLKAKVLFGELFHVKFN